ncbi:hypothetical protein IGI04_009195 [Brassica rapa subsp. trilocularis]|uniref:Uncharacterized protein n=1 Tax=Brassica rapa subsp. trilocularis TaxID=1813537 RepID=A0ABQ7MYZ4_BRACM|nr:hypothetical protein IGI04_009195 [Brassica rapa subsp. trilocularis]
MATVEAILNLLFHSSTKVTTEPYLHHLFLDLPPSTIYYTDVLRSVTTKLDTHEPPPHESSNNKEMRTAFSLPADRTAKSYIASGAGLGRGLGTAGYGGLTRKDPPEIETAAGRATAGRVVPIVYLVDKSKHIHF